jgi:tripartite-type tricarboxylate transporter receptor subunit TctC
MKARGVPVLAAITCIIAMMSIAHGAAAAEPATDFFKGKRMQIWNASSAGGSNDIYSRLIGSYLSEMLGVNVAVISKPGGGGIAAPNELFATAKPDGLTLCLVSSGKLFGDWLMDSKVVQYDIFKYSYIGNIRKGPFTICTSPKGPYPTLEALQKGKGLKSGSSTPSSLLTLSQIVVFETLGIDAKITMGMETAARRLALMQKEIDCSVISHATAMNAENLGEVKRVLQVSDERSEMSPNLPCLTDVAKLSDYQRKLLNLIFDDGVVLIAPPGIPQDRLDLLQEATSKILANKDFQKAAAQFSEGQWPGWDTGKAILKVASNLVASKQDMKLFTPLQKKYIK